MFTHSPRPRPRPWGAPEARTDPAPGWETLPLLDMLAGPPALALALMLVVLLWRGRRRAGRRPLRRIAQAPHPVPAGPALRAVASPAPGAPPARSAQPCAWRQEPMQHKAVTLDRWLCRACGVDAFTADGRPPKDCKRGLGPRAL